MYVIQRYHPAGPEKWVDVGEPFEALGEGYQKMLDESMGGFKSGEEKDLRVIIVGSNVVVLRLSTRRELR